MSAKTFSKKVTFTSSTYLLMEGKGCHYLTHSRSGPEFTLATPIFHHPHIYCLYAELLCWALKGWFKGNVNHRSPRPSITKEGLGVKSSQNDKSPLPEFPTSANVLKTWHPLWLFFHFLSISWWFLRKEEKKKRWKEERKKNVLSLLET